MFACAISPHDSKVMMLNCDMSCAFTTRDGGETWKMIHHSELRSNTSCRPAFHPKEPDVVFAAGDWDGRLRVSRDGGIHWKEHGDLPGGLVELYIDPGGPGFMLAGAGDRVFVSRDAGERWARVESVSGRAAGFHVDQASPKESRTCFAGTSEGVFRSRDGGRTWSPAGAGLPPLSSGGNRLSTIGTPAFAGGSNRGTGECILYVVAPSTIENGRLTGGVYRSRDRGETWRRAMGPGINQETKAADRWADGDIAQYRFVLTTDARPETVYVAGTSTGYMPPHFATVWRSDDAGETWRPVLFTDPRFEKFNVDHDKVTAKRGASYNGAPLGLSISPADPDALIFVDTGNCYVTRNGGEHWTSSHARPRKTGKVGRDESWTCNGLVVTTTWDYLIDPFEPARHYICYTDIGFARSLDGGRTWIWGGESGFPWKNTMYQMALDPETPGKMWGAFSNVHDIPMGNIILGRHGARAPGGVCVSEDFGASWRVSNSGLPEGATTGIVLDPKSPAGSRTLYAGVFDEGVFKSTDDGKSWAKAGRGLGAPGINVRVCRLNLHADGTLDALVTAKVRDGRFSPEGVGLYRSSDGGESWKKITESVTIHWPKDFTVDPRDSRIVYLGASDPERPPRAEEGGLYRTKDGGKTWTRIAREGGGHFGAYLHPNGKWIYMTLAEGTPTYPLWLSKDDGATWVPFTELPFSNILRIRFDSAAPDVIYATTFGGSVWKGPIEPR